MRAVEAMRSSLPLLCYVNFGMAFAPNVAFAPNAALFASSRCAFGRRYSRRSGVPALSRASSGFGRNLAISHEVRVHGDEEGSGSISPATTPQSTIAVTEARIEAVEKEIEAVETALSEGPAYLGITDRDILWKEKERLWKEKEQLWKEKEKLWKKKEQLREEKEEKQLREKERRQLSVEASLLTSGTHITTAVRQSRM